MKDESVIKVCNHFLQKKSAHHVMQFLERVENKAVRAKFLDENFQRGFTYGDTVSMRIACLRRIVLVLVVLVAY